MKAILFALFLSTLACHADDVGARRMLWPVDGKRIKGQYIDTSPKTGERLDIRYGTISDSGVALELTVNGTVVWRAYVEPLLIDHSMYEHEVFVEIDKGTIHVRSVGSWQTIFEERDLRTGKQLYRHVQDGGSRR